MSDPILRSRGDTLLDNPIWNSLATNHAYLALGLHTGHGLARRYPADIGPLSAFQQQTPEAYADLAAIVHGEDIAVLFLEDEPKIPVGWQILRGGTLVQMVCSTIPDKPALDDKIAPIGPAGIPEMVALTRLTEPGPFRHGTAKLGGFLGIRVGGRLAAMAGQRLSLSGFGEVSAVCTHPDFRRRGYAKALVAAVSRNICAEGRTPFLITLEANTQAIGTYQQVGFAVRRTFQLVVLKPPCEFISERAERETKSVPDKE